MLHPTDGDKTYSEKNIDDWTGKDAFCWRNNLFFKIESLDKYGFIHSDGSLRFEFYIKKNDFIKKLKDMEMLAQTTKV